MVTAAIATFRPGDFLELTKPRIVGLVLLTVAAGFVMAAGLPGPAEAVLLLNTLAGTALVAGGTNALNQVFERDVDALMARTRGRPLPQGRLSPETATAFAWALGLGGILYLAFAVNGITALLAALTLGSYVFLYTPLKRRSRVATLVGSVPGALPIVGGWTAGGGGLGIEAWALFWIVFLWQLPHFMSLAWLYRKDYARAGLKTLGASEDGPGTFRQAALYALALLPVSLIPALLHLAGAVYFAGAMLLSGWFVWVSGRAALRLDERAARRVFSASVLYLPALLALMVAGRVV
ncbi:Protoheme IX farnesyltransferase [bacterium HR33]|nr:Protoheme IX farnesyltransferase [bacterium HR33]